MAEIGKAICVCYNLEHVKKVVWDNHESLFLTVDGRPATRDEVLKVIEYAISKGYDVLPSCANVDERGHCLGHDIADEGGCE
jgi:hypothetical protein